jgi:hypothetical protein
VLNIINLSCDWRKKVLVAGSIGCNCNSLIKCAVINLSKERFSSN